MLVTNFVYEVGIPAGRTASGQLSFQLLLFSDSKCCGARILKEKMWLWPSKTNCLSMCLSCNNVPGLISSKSGYSRTPVLGTLVILLFSSECICWWCVQSGPLHSRSGTSGSGGAGPEVLWCVPPAALSSPSVRLFMGFVSFALSLPQL